MNNIKEVKELTLEDAYTNIVYVFENFFKGSPKEVMALSRSLQMIRDVLQEKEQNGRQETVIQQDS